MFDLTAHSVGAIKEPLRLTIERGMVTKIEGGREAKIWRDILEKHGDANSYNAPAEIALGLNPKVTPTESCEPTRKCMARRISAWAIRSHSAAHAMRGCVWKA